MERRNRKRLYLDICTLCRPFADQSQMRIRLETTAYYLIIQALQAARYTMVVLERLGTAADCDVAAARARAENLHFRQFGIADAAHVAFAEAAADFFISCDDRLVKRCKREKLRVPTVNPVEFTIAEDLK